MEKLQWCKTIPSPPGVAEKILTLVEDRSATMNDFAEIIRVDPGLSARLLQLGNSPIYGLRREIYEVQQAITIIGLEATVSKSQASEIAKAWRRKPVGKLLSGASMVVLPLIARGTMLGFFVCTRQEGFRRFVDWMNDNPALLDFYRKGTIAPS